MKLLKFLLKFLLVILIFVAIIVGAIWIALSKMEDDAPIDLYDSDITLESTLSEILDTSFDEMSLDNSLNITFTNEELNKLLFGIVKSKLNSKYNPKTGISDEEKNIFPNITLPSSIPFAGGKKIVIKHIYANITESTLNLYATADAFGLIKTRLAIVIETKEVDDSYILTLKELTIGKINLLSGLGRKALNKILPLINFDDKDINNALRKAKVPLTFNIDNMEFKCTKDDLNDLLKSLIVNKKTENLASSEESDVQESMFTELIDILTNKEYNMIKMGIFKNSDGESEFGIKINLAKIIGDESKTELDAEISNGFDTDLFIKNKTQTLIMNNLTNSGLKKMTFTEMEFNKLIYNKTNGYAGLGMSVKVYGEATFDFGIDGIKIKINKDTVDMILIMNLNGIKTLVTLNCDVIQRSDTEIELIIAEKIILADDIEVNSGFIGDLLTTALGNFKIFEFKKGEGNQSDRFVIKAEAFEAFMSIGGQASPVRVDKISLSNGVLNTYVTITDDTILNMVTTVTEGINQAIKTGIDTSILDVSDPDQARVVQELDQILISMKDDLEENIPLDETLIESYAEKLDELSEENLHSILDQVSGFVDESTINDLYNKLFGNN